MIPCMLEFMDMNLRTYHQITSTCVAGPVLETFLELHVLWVKPRFNRVLNQSRYDI